MMHHGHGCRPKTCWLDQCGEDASPRHYGNEYRSACM